MQRWSGNLLDAEGVGAAVVEQQRLLLAGVVNLMAHLHTQVRGAVDGELLVGVVVDLDALPLLTATIWGANAWFAPKWISATGCSPQV